MTDLDCEDVTLPALAIAAETEMAGASDCWSGKRGPCAWAEPWKGNAQITRLAILIKAAIPDSNGLPRIKRLKKLSPIPFIFCPFTPFLILLYA